MYNTILWFLMTLFGLGVMLLSFRLFGKTGIVATMCAGIIMTNILIVKSVVIFGLAATGNAVLFSFIFLGTDILSEHLGGKEARKAVLITFFVVIFILISTRVTLAMIPAEWDTGHEHLMAVLNPMFRIIIASTTAFLTSNLVDTWSYDLIRKKFPKHLWLRNNGSTLSSQLLDSVVFSTIAFTGVLPVKIIVQITLFSMIIKILIAVLDTPFLYWSKLIVKRHPEILDK